MRIDASVASVLTLVRGRDDRLRNLMRGLGRQGARPRELVIAWMQDEAAPDLPDPGCPVRHLHVPGEPMPLAAARNRAAEAAGGDLLVFLDVDCIPGPGLVAAYAQAAAQGDGLFLGEVLYLPPGACDEADLDRLGRAHPARPPVPDTGLPPSPIPASSGACPSRCRRGPGTRSAAWTRALPAMAARRPISPPA